MRFFTKRRIRNIAIATVVGVICVLIWRTVHESLRPAAVYTGFVLLAVMLGLTFFNARKKLPFLPLFRASTWLQIHIYVGFLSILLFLLHIQFRVPTGGLEIVLTVLFAIVALSGIVGILITRWLPSQVTKSGEPLVYERIPRFERSLRQEVETIVTESEVATGSSAISDFYMKWLAPYFHHSHGVAILVGDSYRYQKRLTDQLDDFSRCYLNDKEQALMEQLRDCIDRKRNLDYQKAAQRVLKLWLFVHIPFTYSLIIVAIVHAWVALGFSGAL